ncbi:MAG: tRNA (adenosine(37)-N6)-threonylcarbamoyltransferase complex transferase subunit TsaD [Desulfovibrio sp.]|uniref:tRNA (adenosine(37)-N6)-threonylcarbamoyltransferase complex transferase subunit TsaD n=1 Tax=Desulfovibrio sp. 7SRBS1 TaxID=3378064 RepID=UPI003B3E42B2
MTVCGIETSCDETGIALVRDGREIGEKLASQAALHSVFGGVVPEIASREHLRVIEPLLEMLFQETGVGHRDITGIAVARGPGLLGSLLVGLGFAKGLALATGAPLVGVNHLHAHLLAAGLEAKLEFPALGVLVSGGHTHLYRIKSPLEFFLLGRTLDDAAGEAFDKGAKLLNLPYPGGRFIDELAQESEPLPKLFPTPYVDNDNLDFSFSGLKTALLQYVNAHPELKLGTLPVSVRSSKDLQLSPRLREQLCQVLASYNFSIAETLRIKVERALCREKMVRSVILAGGVAANSMIRRILGTCAERAGLLFSVPSLPLCADNARMIAYAGEILLDHGRRHDSQLEAIPRGRKVPEDFLLCSGL